MSATVSAPIPMKRTMRDTLLSEILGQMDRGENVFLLSADFGAPALDAIRERHAERFINVGISEQNLINVATGLALEGYTVYAYAIAPFITMRCCEQIRVNLAILSQVRPMNVNLIGVGAGFSYEVSGPTHHCLEDISIMRTFPNMHVISPSDVATAAALGAHCLGLRKPKYLRLDAKPVATLHESVSGGDMRRGFKVMRQGGDVCVIATGSIVHKVNEVCAGLNIGLVDQMVVKGFDESAMVSLLKRYKKVVTVEEGFTGKGGLDAAIGTLILSNRLPTHLKAMGLKDNYIFHIGSREHLHEQNDLGRESILREASSVA